MNARTITAILDTNVIVDIYAANDLLEAYEKHGGESDAALFRRVRARESLLLAWYLHLTGATTLALSTESSRILVRRAAPDAMHTFESQHVQLSIYFVKDYVLDRWDDRTVRGADAGLNGVECDDKLLELAKEHRAPLVSNEGYSLCGVSNDDPKKLRAKAITEGIAVYTPRQFWAGRMGERACKKFLSRYDAEAPKYLRSQGGSEAAQKALDMRRAILRHVLFGETSTGARLPVRLQERKSEP